MICIDKVAFRNGITYAVEYIEDLDLLSEQNFIREAGYFAVQNNKIVSRLTWGRHRTHYNYLDYTYTKIKNYPKEGT